MNIFKYFCFFWCKNDQNPLRNDFTIIFLKNVVLYEIYSVKSRVTCPLTVGQLCLGSVTLPPKKIHTSPPPHTHQLNWQFLYLFDFKICVSVKICQKQIYTSVREFGVGTNAVSKYYFAESDIQTSGRIFHCRSVSSRN